MEEEEEEEEEEGAAEKGRENDTPSRSGAIRQARVSTTVSSLQTGECFKLVRCEVGFLASEVDQGGHDI